MGNMSYCRFKNTSLDLGDCLDAIENQDYRDLADFERDGLEALLGSGFFVKAFIFANPATDRAVPVIFIVRHAWVLKMRRQYSSRPMKAMAIV